MSHMAGMRKVEVERGYDYSAYSSCTFNRLGVNDVFQLQIQFNKENQLQFQLQPKNFLLQFLQLILVNFKCNPSPAPTSKSL